MRPRNPAEEGFNPNTSQTDQLPSSTLTTRKQELVGETTTETTHFEVAGEHHEEQDGTCEGKRPEDQAAGSDDKRSSTRPGAESEEPSHGEGHR